jgi:AcrR family transcriptional regulator
MGAAHATGRRWGANTRVDDDGTARELLVDAAESCFDRLGVPSTTVEDVARAAQVSRNTVYRYFPGGRDELIVAAYLRESAAILELVQSLLRAPGSFAERTGSIVAAAVDGLRAGRYFPALFDDESRPLTSRAITASAEFQELARRTVGPFFHTAQEQGELPPGMQLDDYIEWHIRIIFSFAILDSPIARDAEDRRRLIEAFVAQGLRTGATDPPGRRPKKGAPR